MKRTWFHCVTPLSTGAVDILPHYRYLPRIHWEHETIIAHRRYSSHDDRRRILLPASIPALILVLFAALVGPCVTEGCFYLGQERFEDVVRTDPSAWSSRDCLTVILASMVHNLNDNDKNVECIATPFYPSVVVALNRIQRSQYHWSEDDARFHMDELLRGSSGLYVDWRDGRFVNAKGNYFKDQTDIDSLLIVVTLKNKTYPCATPYATVVQPGPGEGLHYASVPLLATADWPCYVPNIADIDKRVWMVNDRGDTLRPTYVWGRRHETLTSTETLFVMFPLRHGRDHFLAGSGHAWFEISGFDTKLKFAMDTARMR